MGNEIQKTGGRSISPLDRKFGTVRGLLDKMGPQFAKVLPRHISADKLIRVALTTWRSGDALMECEPLSFAGAVLECAQLGLIPDSILGRAHLVPFWNGKRQVRECNVVLGYQGLVELALRSGQVKDINAQVVYQNDNFEFEYGTEERLKHSWNPMHDDGDRGKPIAVYMFARLRDGEQHFQVLPWSKILQTRDRALNQRKAWIEVDKETGEERAMKRGKNGNYSFDTPWVTDTPEMARKTAIRYGSKLLPLSSEFQRAASLDERNDLGLEQGLMHGVAEVLPDEEFSPLQLQTGSDAAAGAATRTSAASLKERLLAEEAQLAQQEEEADEDGVVHDEGSSTGDDLPPEEDPYANDPAALTEEEEAQLEAATQRAKAAKAKAAKPKGAVKKKRAGGRKPVKKAPLAPPTEQGDDELPLGQPQGEGPSDEDIPF